MANTEPTYADVAAAAGRLAGHAFVTPLLHSPVLNERTGATVLIKAEILQIGGAFKFRGAFNRLVQLNADERARGVVAWSSGNHAQGVAAAAQRLGIHAAIVIPSDAPAIKVEGTRRLGAEIIFYDRRREDRERIGRELAKERGATLVPSYDDPHIIAGQGTVAIETIAQAKALYDATLNAMLVPCGGGGLISGCALALNALSPSTRIYSVEPLGFDDTAHSLVSGKREPIDPNATTACDALMSPMPGALTFPINQRLLTAGLSVTDEMVFDAMAFAWRELKLVVEPGGAVALAAVLHGVIGCHGKTIGLVLSGGNVDPELYAKVLATRTGTAAKVD
ncbi:MAG TPA: threonine/serine dehydratase [Steroidobacteraceae bacterium]